MFVLCSHYRMRTRGELLIFAIAFALRGARKLVRGLHHELTEEERYRVADDFAHRLKRHGDPCGCLRTYRHPRKGIRYNLHDLPRRFASFRSAHKSIFRPSLTISDKVEAAYRRGAMLAKRHKLMAEWEGFLRRGRIRRASAAIAESPSAGG